MNLSITARHARAIGAALVLVVLAMGGCSTQRELVASDGHRQTYRFGSNGLPDPVKQDGLHVTGIGLGLEGGRDPMVFWGFSVQSEGPVMRAIRVDYVGDPIMPPLSVSDTAPGGTKNFAVKGPRKPARREAFLSDGQDNLFLFRMKITLADGREVTLYQPTVITAAFEAMFQTTPR